jgi:uncharacterized protein
MANLFFPSILFAAGLTAGGYFIGHGISHRNDGSRSISVKGLSEKEVPASIAIWQIAYSSTGNDLAEINQKLASSTDAVRAFLKASGFEEKDMATQPPLVRDLSMDERDKDSQPLAVRYIASQSVLLRTSNVDQVKPAVASVSQLIAAGVELSGSKDPDYSFNKLNEIKPEMIAEATKNARTAGEQFSRDAATPARAFAKRPARLVPSGKPRCCHT